MNGVEKLPKLKNVDPRIGLSNSPIEDINIP